VLKVGGFIESDYDACVFYRRVGKALTLIGVHVDDLLVTSDEAEEVTYVEDLLRAAFENINVSYDTSDYLGMRITKREKRVEVAMSEYVDECIKASENFGKLREYASPAVGELFEQGHTPKLDTARREVFHSSVAKLLYLAKRVRPDIHRVKHCFQ
jgi:hypothetical protein